MWHFFSSFWCQWCTTDITRAGKWSSSTQNFTYLVPGLCDPRQSQPSDHQSLLVSLWGVMILLQRLLRNHAGLGSQRSNYQYPALSLLPDYARLRYHPADHCSGSVISIRIAPDRTSLRTVLKRVVLTLLDSGGGVLSRGTGGAGTVGGVGAWR